MAELGVNIDHVATVRQARQTDEPDPDTGLAFVYVRFRDGAGNVSDVIYGDGIIYDPPTLVLPGLWDWLWLVLDLRNPWFADMHFVLTPLNLGDLGFFGGRRALAMDEPITAAHISSDGDPLYYAGVSFDLQAYDTFSQPVTQFGAPFTMTIRYEDSAKLFADLTNVGARNALAQRNRSLVSRDRFDRMLRILTSADRNDTIQLELELVYGHCWGGGGKAEPGDVKIDASHIPRRYG